MIRRLFVSTMVVTAAAATLLAGATPAIAATPAHAAGSAGVVLADRDPSPPPHGGNDGGGKPDSGKSDGGHPNPGHPNPGGPIVLPPKPGGPNHPGPGDHRPGDGDHRPGPGDRDHHDGDHHDGDHHFAVGHDRDHGGWHFYPRWGWWPGLVSPQQCRDHGGHVDWHDDICDGGRYDGWHIDD